MIKSIKYVLVLIGSITFAQTDQISGTIDAVQEDGLYRIRIPQKIRSYNASNFSDLRIWDAKGHQVPYFLEPATPYRSIQVSDFTEFSVLSKSKTADTTSTYIFKNPNETLEKAVLLIANYQGSKTYKLQGSNDQEEWFGIVNSGQLDQLSHPTETSVYKPIHFPLCKYPFIKLVFDDRHSLPINLLKIGMSSAETFTIVPSAMEEIPVKTIAFSENEKKTQIHITFERPEVINQIRMAITAPELYSRDASLYILKEREVKRKTESHRQRLASLNIRSDRDLIFDISQEREKELYLEIDNYDNPKLEISGIHFMQNSVYMVASLKKGETYLVTAGNETLKQPTYDISEFAHTKAKKEFPIIEISAIAKVHPDKPTETKTSFWQHPWFMWSCIGVAVLMISYFTLGLLKDLNKGKE